MFDLIIIGGGPAGLAATTYAVRKRLNVLLLSKDLGGKTNYRLTLPWTTECQTIQGLEIVNKFRADLEELEFAHFTELVEKVEKLDDHFMVRTGSGTSFESPAVIIATGSRHVRLNVAGEKDYAMKGLCYSAISYAPLFVDKSVIVIGDTELALRSAGELAGVAKAVTMVCSSSKFMGTVLGMKLQLAHNVKILRDREIIAVTGDKYARRLILRDRMGNTEEHAADGMFVEKALIPNVDMVRDLVQLDELGRILIDHACRTNVPGLFAAGDVSSTYAEQIIVAVGEGAKAALSAYEYLLPSL